MKNKRIRQKGIEGRREKAKERKKVRSGRRRLKQPKPTHTSARAADVARFL
jgi:hypothetical protein